MGESRKQSELHANDVFSREMTFSAAEIIAFSMGVSDENPLHHDAEFAAGSHVGGLSASESHTTAVLLAFAASRLSACGPIAWVWLAIRFAQAVPAGERVTLEWIVDSTWPDSRGSGTYVEMKGRLRKSDDGELFVAVTGVALIGDISLPPSDDPRIPVQDAVASKPSRG